jgi:hypothetical protein
MASGSSRRSERRRRAGAPKARPWGHRIAAKLGDNGACAAARIPVADPNHINDPAQDTDRIMAGTRYPLPLGADPPSVDIDAGTMARIDSPLPGPIGLAGEDAGAAKSAPSLGAKVLQFARDRVGQRVGDGECFALADQALRAAGAKSAADFGPVTADGDYVWGSAVAAVASVQAGDIVQFRNYVYTRREENDEGWQESSEERPHHTAIVVSNDGNGMLTVIEQNAPPGTAVRTIRLGFSSGSTQSGNTTVRVTVTGRTWFYRPLPR